MCELASWFGQSGRRIPDDRAELLTLPGVGAYVADAILCYAYGRKTVPVDSNVCRVLGRMFGLRTKREARRSRVFVDKAASLPITERNAREVNWGLIDFAALVCRPRRPVCTSCPISDVCLYPDKTKD